MSKLDEFINGFPEKHTQKTYRMHLKNYFDTIKADPKTYFADQRDYEQDVKEFWQQLQKYAPLTIISRMSCIKLFLEENDVIVSQKIWKNLRKRTKGRRAITLDTIPTNQELKQILQHGSVLMRSIALLLSSSGMRIGEVLELLPGDIDINHDPVKIYIRAEITKTGGSRVTFASNEFKELFQEWLKIRDNFMKRAVARSNYFGGKNPDDKRIFPINHPSVCKKWYLMLQKAGLDERDSSTGYYRMHIHTLRKFFETRMSNMGVPEAVYQKLEGHEGYLGNAYKRYGERELIEWYKKGVQELLIFEAIPDLSGVHEQLKEKDKQIQNLQMQLTQLQTDFVSAGLRVFSKNIQNKHPKK